VGALVVDDLANELGFCRARAGAVAHFDGELATLERRRPLRLRDDLGLVGRPVMRAFGLRDVVKPCGLEPSPGAVATGARGRQPERVADAPVPAADAARLVGGVRRGRARATRRIIHSAILPDPAGPCEPTDPRPPEEDRPTSRTRAGASRRRASRHRSRSRGRWPTGGARFWTAHVPADLLSACLDVVEDRNGGRLPNGVLGIRARHADLVPLELDGILQMPDVRKCSLVGEVGRGGRRRIDGNRKDDERRQGDDPVLPAERRRDRCADGASARDGFQEPELDGGAVGAFPIGNGPELEAGQLIRDRAVAGDGPGRQRRGDQRERRIAVTNRRFGRALTSRRRRHAGR
jgi:hypothetical protein